MRMAIGYGSIGGKASGLVFIKDLLAEEIDRTPFPEVDINVLTMAVIAMTVNAPSPKPTSSK